VESIANLNLKIVENQRLALNRRLERTNN